jgi:hypothetical protein
MAKGALDVHLTGNPHFTYWRSTIQRHTNFATESLGQVFNSTVAFGANCTLTANRTGDMMSKVYLKVTLVGLQGKAHPQGSASGFEGYADYFGSVTGELQDSNLTNFNHHGDIHGDQTSTILGNAEYKAAYLFGGDTNAVNQTDQTLLVNSAYNYRPQLNGYVDDITVNSGHFEGGGVGDNALTRPHAAHWACWVNEIGHAIIKRVTMSIGGQKVEDMDGLYLHIWEELSGQPGKRLEEMIGKRYTLMDLITDSANTRTLYVPLPFSFARRRELALPLVALQFHGVQFTVEFEDLHRLIIVNRQDTVPLVKTTQTQITAQDLSANLEIEYVYLDQVERDNFAMGHFTQLTNQIQIARDTSNQATKTLQLNFNHPVQELVWVVRRNKNITKNRQFDLSGPKGRDPIKSVKLVLNGQQRFENTGTYFRTVQPYCHHNLIPESFIYCFSFALTPEDIQPSGSLNFSRIDNAQLEITFSDDMANDEDKEVRVYARNWNLMKYSSGLGGLMYSS